jgi:alpha-amylase
LTKYCGGTWAGIEAQLDYIAGMGFDAIWISPIPTNLGNDYHGYAFLNLYEVNPHFGTEAELKSLIATAHAKNIWIMLDVVGNHVAPVDLDFSQITPFNQSAYYHDKCQIEDWSNQEQVEMCRLANLPDLDQSNSYVRSTLLSWVSTLASYGFDGLRVDTIPEVTASFWSEFNAAAGMYCVGEVFNGDISYVSNYQNYLDGVLSYPLFYTMLNVFAYQQNMSQLETLLGPNGTYASKFRDVNLLGTFIDNHDNSRFLYNQASWVLYKNALALTLLTTGIPIVYYGSEQGYSGGADPANRESLWPNYNTAHDLYQFIKSVVSVRKSQKVYAYQQIQRYSTSNFYAFSRGNTLACFTNTGGSSSVTYNLTYLPYSSGTVVCNALASVPSSDCITVTSGGLTVTLSGGIPKVFVPK